MNPTEIAFGTLAQDLEHDVDRPELCQTPSGWLALGNDFPRIGVMASTREEAERLFRAEREAWRELAQR